MQGGEKLQGLRVDWDGRSAGIVGLAIAGCTMEASKDANLFF